MSYFSALAVLRRPFLDRAEGLAELREEILQLNIPIWQHLKDGTWISVPGSWADFLVATKSPTVVLSAVASSITRDLLLQVKKHTKIAVRKFFKVNEELVVLFATMKVTDDQLDQIFLEEAQAYIAFSHAIAAIDAAPIEGCRVRSSVTIGDLLPTFRKVAETFDLEDPKWRSLFHKGVWHSYRQEYRTTYGNPKHALDALRIAIKENL